MYFTGRFIHTPVMVVSIAALIGGHHGSEARGSNSSVSIFVDKVY